MPSVEDAPFIKYVLKMVVSLLAKDRCSQIAKKKCVPAGVPAGTVSDVESASAFPIECPLISVELPTSPSYRPPKRTAPKVLPVMNLERYVHPVPGSKSGPGGALETRITLGLQ